MSTQLVKHLGMIMDGNRRWAVTHNKHKFFGHQAGFNNLQLIVAEVIKLKIPYLTVYALSRDNLQKREQKELANIFKLFLKGMDLILQEHQNIELKILGMREGLDDQVLAKIDETNNHVMQQRVLSLRVAFNYDGREEVVKAAKKCGEGLTVAALQKELAGGVPNPELIVRTGGAHRLSGFLLWQSVYAEMVVLDTLWPDFTIDQLHKILSAESLKQKNWGA